MLHIGLKSVRHYLTLFLGSFLTMLLGVALIGTAATCLAARWSIPVATNGPRVSINGAAGTHVYFRDAVDLQGITTILALAAVVTGFVMVTNVAGTFSFSIALRRRDIGLLRLLGAGPGQVRRLVLGEAVAVALPAAGIGCLLAAMVSPPILRALSHTELAPVPLPDNNSLGALLFAYAVGVFLAVLAALLASLRASRVHPVEALRDAAIDRQVMTRGRWVVGGLALIASTVMLSRVSVANAHNATPLAIFGTFGLTIAAINLGPAYLPVLIRVVGFPIRRSTGVAGWLAVARLTMSRRHCAALAAPVLSLIAVTGIMMGVLQTTDTTERLDQIARAQAQLVVEPLPGRSLDPATLDRIAAAPGVSAVSAPATLKVVFDTVDGEPFRSPGGLGTGLVMADALDLPELAALSTEYVVEGELVALTGNQVAVREEYISWYDVHAGSTLRLAFFDGRTVDVTVAVILSGGADLPQIMLSPQLAGGQVATPTRAFVRLDAPAVTPVVMADLVTAIGTDRVRVMPVARWHEAIGAERDHLQNLVLLVLIGPAALFALVAVANTAVMSFSRRGRELGGLRMLGVSRGHLWRMVLLEQSLLTFLAVGVAAVFLTVALTGYRTALSTSFLATAIRAPWLVLAGLAAACLVVAVASGLLAAARVLRRPATMTASPE